jgi:hypothetical protein
MEHVHSIIIAETEALAARYRTTFQGDPWSELLAWLEIAARREAMVREVYGAAQRRERLPEITCPAEATAWDALTEIWQQEAVHTEAIHCRLSDGAFTSRGSALKVDVLQLVGEAEGRMLCALTSKRPTLGQLLAKLVTQLGTAVAPAMVPALAGELRALDSREFFRLAAVLELTARQSYERMLEVMGMLSRLSLVPVIQQIGFSNEVSRIRRDEQFHQDAFGVMAEWTLEDGTFDASLTSESCVDGIARLLPPAAAYKRKAAGPRTLTVATDGGLSGFFARHGVNVVVA